ncbi:MAG TPA: tyrosine/phenylalanine carboxypeptidase domain-containing protein [Patescibacteria group bacterium]|nr:tyrosine/phenylalanine carboxypeptidase domain-containing protein [Patescibacteria group bacterium]
MKFFERASGILGMNARNLLYIGRYNSKASKRFADDKLFTKNYLSSRGLGVAKIFHVIKNYNELRFFNPDSLPKSFVIKPNRGYGGEGIIVIKDRTHKKFIEVSDETYTWEDMYRHITAILDGQYAISGLHDQVIIEERLEAAEYLKPYLEVGLPDIRIIVFNYVPIIAMLRLPTRESRGKANLHLGGVGVGIDIATGKATHAVQHGRFITRLPNGEKITTLTIPNWDDVLLAAAQAQHVSQIGFLAVDIAPASSGIKILELNARPGLSVQIANQVPLKNRLRKVSDLKVPNPEKGVAVSKTLFSSNLPKEKKEKPSEKTVIGLYEEIDILNTDYTNILAKIDPHGSEVVADASLKNLVDPGEAEHIITVKLKNQRVTAPFKYADLQNEKHKVILGGKYLGDFLIDVALHKAAASRTAKKVVKGTDEKIVQSIDKKLFDIDQKINILSHVKPLNLEQAKRDFFHNFTTNPRFYYRPLSVDVERTSRELQALPQRFNHPLAKLYKDKITELHEKLALVTAIDTPGLQDSSERLYGRATETLLKKAQSYIKENPIQEDESEAMSFKTVEKKLTEFLEGHKLSQWKIKVSPVHAADISVNRAGTIFLREGAEFTENRFKAVVVHEIATHIFRSENARLQKYHIFEAGPNYLTTEEGLAVYNQKQLGIPLGEKDHWPALRTVGAYLASRLSFVELFHELKKDYGLSDETAWKTCLKAKRGLIDTSQKIAFTRDLIYFRGYNLVKEYIEKNPATGLRDLYIGKIDISDLKHLEKIESYPVKHLPNYEEVRALL